MQPLPARRPVIVAVLSTILLVLLLGVAGTVLYLTDAPLSSPVPLVFLPIAVCVLAALGRRRGWGSMGFRWPAGSRTATILYAASAVAIVAVAAGAGGPSTREPLGWLWLVAFVALVALVEELLFRGIVLRLLLARGPRAAIAGSALLFAVAHAVNVLGGQEIGTTVRQILFALVFGAAMAILVLTTGAIWPAMLIHGLVDLVQLGGTHATSAFVDGVSIALFACGSAAALLFGPGSGALVRARPKLPVQE